MINVPELGGNFGAAFFTNLWEPPGHGGTGDALVRGALGLVYHTAKNIVREFLPERLHRNRPDAGKSTE